MAVRIGGSGPLIPWVRRKIRKKTPPPPTGKTLFLVAAGTAAAGAITLFTLNQRPAGPVQQARASVQEVTFVSAFSPMCTMKFKIKEGLYQGRELTTAGQPTRTNCQDLKKTGQDGRDVLLFFKLELPLTGNKPDQQKLDVVGVEEIK